MQGSYGYKKIEFFLIWKDLAQGSNHESIIIIGEDLKQMATLIHSRVHKEQLQTKNKEARGVHEREQIAKNSRKNLN